MIAYVGPELEATVTADQLMVGDKLYDRMLAGTHGQRVVVEWVRPHVARKRIYVAGYEEMSKNPVTLGYDATTTVKIYR